MELKGRYVSDRVGWLGRFISESASKKHAAISWHRQRNTSLGWFVTILWHFMRTPCQRIYSPYVQMSLHCTTNKIALITLAQG
jgi:hypothetical protein